MKINKSLIRLVLLALCIILITACSSTADDVSSEAPDFGEVDKLDLNGMDVVFLGVTGEPKSAIFYSLDSFFGDMMIERLRSSEAELNYNLVCDGSIGDNATRSGVVQSAVMASEAKYDLYLNSTSKSRGDAIGGYLYGFYDLLEYLDYTNEDVWGTPVMLESMLWNENLFGVVPMGLPMVSYGNFYGAISINEEMVKKYNVTDPRDLLENGIWNWDTFQTTLAEMYVKEGDSTIYAFKVHTPYYFEAFSRSNGDNFVVKENGKYTLGWYTASGRKALEVGNDILFNTCKEYFHPALDTDRNQFVEKTVFMVNYEGGEVVQTTYNDFECGVVPFPTGPDMKEPSYRTFTQSLKGTCSIVANSKAPEAAAMVLNSLCQPFEGYEDRAKVIEYLKRYYFADERDADTLLRMCYNAYYCYYAEGSRDLLKFSAGHPVSEILESIENQAQNLLENYCIPTRNAMRIVFGSDEY